jgi:hypothetical protein
MIHFLSFKLHTVSTVGRVSLSNVTVTLSVTSRVHALPHALEFRDSTLN